MSIQSSLRRRARKFASAPAAEPRNNGASSAVRTYWNGEPADCRRVVVRVGRVERPTWWCAGMEGTERRAVEVNYGNQIFYLDDENGSAWLKVTRGGGGPEWGHKSLPDDSVVVRESEQSND